MIYRQNASLVVIDVQQRLTAAMADWEPAFDNLSRLLRGAAAIELPVITTEQFPEKLGATVQPLRDLLPNPAIPKTTFSCCLCPAFMETLSATGRDQIVLCGIETHVCVCQTALGLVEAGLDVYVVADAVASRTTRNRDLALQRLSQEGVTAVSTEMFLFEMLDEASGPLFKTILNIVK